MSAFNWTRNPASNAARVWERKDSNAVLRVRLLSTMLLMCEGNTLSLSEANILAQELKSKRYSGNQHRMVPTQSSLRTSSTVSF
jgi:hypothetical protein